MNRSIKKEGPLASLLFGAAGLMFIRILIVITTEDLKFDSSRQFNLMLSGFGTFLAIGLAIWIMLESTKCEPTPNKAQN